jgi:hypothetical protein
MDKQISSNELLLVVKTTIEEDLLLDDQAGAIIGDRTQKVTEVATEFFNKSLPISKK